MVWFGNRRPQGRLSSIRREHGRKRETRKPKMGERKPGANGKLRQRNRAIKDLLGRLGDSKKCSSSRLGRGEGVVA